LNHDADQSPLASTIAERHALTSTVFNSADRATDDPAAATAGNGDDFCPKASGGGRRRRGSFDAVTEHPAGGWTRTDGLRRLRPVLRPRVDPGAAKLLRVAPPPPEATKAP